MASGSGAGRAALMRGVWNGRIPLRVELSPDSVALPSEDGAPPAYMMVRRTTYLPLIMQELSDHFADHVGPMHAPPPDEDDRPLPSMWFSYNGRPLQWHFPIGVLYDVECGVDDADIPWPLMVHFDAYPSDRLLRPPSHDSSRAIYMNVLKEASYMKWGSTKMLTELKTETQKTLWTNIAEDNFDEFWKVFAGIQENSDDTGGQPMTNIPYRIYVKDAAFVQEPMAPVREDGSVATVQDLLASISTRPSMSDVDVDTCDVVGHGIKVHLDTPLEWLAMHCCYPDQFVHLALHA